MGWAPCWRWSDKESEVGDEIQAAIKHRGMILLSWCQRTCKNNCNKKMALTSRNHSTVNTEANPGPERTQLLLLLPLPRLGARYRACYKWSHSGHKDIQVPCWRGSLEWKTQVSSGREQAQASPAGYEIANDAPLVHGQWNEHPKRWIRCRCSRAEDKIANTWRQNSSEPQSWRKENIKGPYQASKDTELISQVAWETEEDPEVNCKPSEGKRSWRSNDSGFSST